MSMDALCPEAPLYRLPVDMNPAVSIPTVYLKTGCQSVVSLTGRRTGPYGAPLETIGLREKVFIVVLSVVLTTLVSLIASLAIMMGQPKPNPDESTMAYIPTDTDKRLRIAALHSSGFPEKTQHDTPNGGELLDSQANGREPCVGECWSYSAFRFRSKCISGYCICHGNFYDETTCLPNVYGCNIKRNNSASVSYLTDQEQTVYTCSTRPAKDQRRTFVLSTYGHHNTRETTVDITAMPPWSNRSLTLVLANYFPTKWRLRLQDDVKITKIVLISNDHVTTSSVVISDASINPLVRKTSYPVGYGDDRYGGHTVSLLKYVRRKFGPVITFHGSHYADRWRVVLTGPAHQQSGANYSDPTQ